MVHPQSCKYVKVIDPDVVDNASATSAEIDCAGYEYLTVIFYVGDIDIAISALSLQESDTSGSGFANITGTVFGTATDIAGTTSVLPTASGGDNDLHVFEVDLKPRKRYLKVLATVGDGTEGANLASVAMLWRAHESPANTSAGRGCTTVLRV